MGIDSSQLAGFCVNIVSQQPCNGRNLALAVNLDAPSGQAVVAPFDPAQPSQLWLPVLFVVPANGPWGTKFAYLQPVFVNLLSGLALFYPAQGGSAEVQQAPLSQISPAYAWTIADLGNGYTAVRPFVDSTQNWSISKPAWNAGLITNDWSRGQQPWNSWTCVYPSLTNDASLAPYLAAILPNLPLLTFVDLDGMALADTGGLSENVVIQTPNSKDTSQQWLGLWFWKNNASGAMDPSGFTFVNVSTGNLVRYAGAEGSPLSSSAPSSVDTYSSWTPGDRMPFGYAGHYYAIRPACDSTQNINVTQNRTTPGQWVSTWGWQGSDPHGWDIWLPTSISPTGTPYGPFSERRASRPPSAVPASQQLVPPLGATWGLGTSTTTPRTAPMSWDDDHVMGSGTQTGSATLQNQFYVYWVDGVSKPYYIVVLRQTLAFAPGTLLAQGNSSYGFFQYLTGITNTVLDGNGNPFAAGAATLLSYNPTSFNPSPGQNPPVAINVPMVLLTVQNGRKVPTQFNASDTESVTLADWAIADGTQGLTQALTFHQVTNWDPTRNAPGDWAKFYLDRFDPSTGNVTQPPPTSTGSLQLSVLSGWSFSVPNSGPTAPSFKVQFSNTLTQRLAAMHNPTACKTVITGFGQFPTIAGGYHINDVESAYPSYVTPLDLGSIVSQSLHALDT